MPKNKRKTVYVFQGGGALGSFQVGGAEALFDAGYNADMVVGISIGGINAAILAGNKPENRINKLKQFWERITVDINSFGLGLPDFNEAKVTNFLGAQFALLAGQPGFFTPKFINPWIMTNGKPEDFAFYDTTPLRKTLEEFIDFDYLNKGYVRLCLGVTDLETGDFVFFDSTKDKITTDHVLASAALPPSFPAIKIDGRYYVDGGVYANTPLAKVFDETYSDNTDVLCFMFDLFSAEGVLPHSIDGMLERIKDIQYSSHSKRSTSLYATTQNLTRAIRFLGSKLSEDVVNTPEVQQILNLGNVPNLDLIHIIYHSRRGTELHSKDYNFNAAAREAHYKQGFTITSEVIKNGNHQWDNPSKDFSRIYTIDRNNQLVEVDV